LIDEYRYELGIDRYDRQVAAARTVPWNRQNQQRNKYNSEPDEPVIRHATKEEDEMRDLIRKTLALQSQEAIERHSANCSPGQYRQAHANAVSARTRLRNVVSGLLQTPPAVTADPLAAPIDIDNPAADPPERDATTNNELIVVKDDMKKNQLPGHEQHNHRKRILHHLLNCTFQNIDAAVEESDKESEQLAQQDQTITSVQHDNLQNLRDGEEERKPSAVKRIQDAFSSMSEELEHAIARSPNPSPSRSRLHQVQTIKHHHDAMNTCKRHASGNGF
jgi:hypothetical protein